MIRHAIKVFLLSALLVGSGFAQDGPKGIAFAEAPEQSSGHCISGSPEKTLACARDKCAEGGAAPQDCIRVAWCYPMMWSVDIFMQHREGPHWHDYLCGWQSREALEKAVAVKCDRTLHDYLVECSAVRFWDPDGNEIAAN